MKYTLKEWRGLKGISQEDLGRRIKKSAGTIYNWEQGVTKPRPSDIEALKKAMGLKASDSIIVRKQ